jgi:signal peptidase complex subunit 3
MQNVWVRLNAVVFFALTVLMVLAALCAFSTFLHKGDPVVKELRVSEMQSLQPYGGVDRALFKFDLKADLRPAWHWNLKQLFVFVVAEYESPTKPLNQVIVWDKIIESPKDANIDRKGELCKYALASQEQELRNKTITLKLIWDHMPITGRLYNGEGTAPSYKLPGQYMKAAPGGSSSSSSSSSSSTRSSGAKARAARKAAAANSEL